MIMPCSILNTVLCFCSFKSLYNFSISTSIINIILKAIPSPSSSIAINKCFNVTLPSLSSFASRILFSIILFKSGVYKLSSLAVVADPIIFINSFLKFVYVILYFFNIFDASLSSFNMASNKCSLPTYGCLKSYLINSALLNILLISKPKFSNILVPPFKLYVYNV